jgi:hypothetical protein
VKNQLLGERIVINDVHDDTHVLVTCRECGAAVMSPDIHEAWHTRIDPPRMDLLNYDTDLLLKLSEALYHIPHQVTLDANKRAWFAARFIELLRANPETVYAVVREVGGPFAELARIGALCVAIERAVAQEVDGVPIPATPTTEVNHWHAVRDATRDAVTLAHKIVAVSS